MATRIEEVLMASGNFSLLLYNSDIKRSIPEEKESSSAFQTLTSVDLFMRTTFFVWLCLHYFTFFAEYSYEEAYGCLGKQ